MKRIFACAAAYMLLISSVIGGEQKVYKCVGPNDSVVFSPQPCGASAQEVNVDVTPHAVSSSTPDTLTASKRAQQNDADASLRAMSDSVADAQCERDARKLYIEPDTSEIANLQMQIAGLESSQYMSNTSQGMTVTAQSQLMQQSDRARAASLRAVVATKQMQNETVRTESRKLMQEALLRCDQQKRAHLSASH
jgi:hypothetical protein